MADLFRLYRRYTTELPPFAVRQQLEQVVQPPPAHWRRWLGFLPRCWGTIDAGASTFWARVPHGRSSGPLVQGQWQPAPGGGSLVELTGRLTAGTWLSVGIFLGWCLFVVSLIVISVQPVRLSGSAGFFSLLGLLFALLILANLRWSLRRARRYFEDALQLTPLPT